MGSSMSGDFKLKVSLESPVDVFKWEMSREILYTDRTCQSQLLPSYRGCIDVYIPDRPLSIS